MNKQIRELAEQAADGMLSYDAEGEWRLNQKEVEKFARLIVQECVTVVVDAVDHREPASTYASKIQQHFGVE
jgi:hypothetical protein